MLGRGKRGLCSDFVELDHDLFFARFRLGILLRDSALTPFYWSIAETLVVIGLVWGRRSRYIVIDLLAIYLSLQLFGAVFSDIVLRSCQSIHRVGLLERALLQRPVYLVLHLVVHVLEAAL